MLNQEPTTILKKIALVGTCPSSRMLAPYKDPSWTIWACSENNAYGTLPRADAWFELHADLRWANPPAWEEPFFRWLNAQSFTIFAQRLDIFPKAKLFPKDDMVREFGPYWFTSSLAWMMAYAIMQKPAEIGLFGIDMAAPSEYGHQKPGLLYLINEAARRGIDVSVPAESDLLRPPPLYGYSVGTDMGRKWEMRRRELKTRVEQLQAKRATTIEQFDREILHLSGALDQLDYDIQTWTGGEIEKSETVATAPTDVVRLDMKRREA